MLCAPTSPCSCSVSFLSGFVSMDTDGFCVYPTLQGCPWDARPSSLSLSPSSFSCYYHFILTLTTMCYFIHNVIPSILPLLSFSNTNGVLTGQHWFCHHAHEDQHRNTTEAGNMVRLQSLGFSFSASLKDATSQTFLKKPWNESLLWCCLYCGVSSLCAGFIFASVTHSIHESQLSS